MSISWQMKEPRTLHGAPRSPGGGMPQEFFLYTEIKSTVRIKIIWDSGKLAKNKISKFIIRHLPFGPQIAQSIKRGLKKTNTKFRLQLPEAEIEDFAQARFAEGIKIIFVGHFHRQYLYRNRDSKELHVLPDWFSTQKVTVYHHDVKEIRFLHWEEIGP